MSTEGDEPGPHLFDPFSAAEAACDEAIDAILTEGGRLLFDAYIERKSFPFASEAVSHVLVSELKMHFVRCDAGEPQAACADSHLPEVREAGACGDGVGDPERERDGWALEREPARCRIDTWARACVPVRRKLVRPKVATSEESRRRPRAKASSASNTSLGRSPSRAGGTGPLEQPEARGVGTPRPQMIPLVEDREEDEEEAVMRDMKEREARRKREEETRVQRKAAEEAEEAARLAQVKDQMKNKPFTYDTNGNIIWVQPLKTNKLPNTNPAPAYSFKKEAAQQSGDHTASGKPPLARGQPSDARSGRRRPERRREGEFTDSFKKFAAQQPSMLEVMTLAPGVELSERGHKKRGADTERGRSGPPMTRKDYEAMVQNGGGYMDHADKGSQGAARSASAAPSEESPRPEAPLASTDAEGAPSQGEARDGLHIRKVPHPPASTRPVQPAAPPSFRRVQMKRGALGYTMSSRERAPTGAVSRYPNCAAQPPLGATMGHGLAPVEQKQEEYYFPHAPPQNAASSVMDEGPGPTSARSAGGKLVSGNPDLVRRLFPR